MRTNRLKQAVKAGLATPLGWRLAAPLRRRGVVVLMYHRINDGASPFPGMPIAQFRAQMQWIRGNCTPIWPEEIPDSARRAHRIRPPVVVSFDDGYRDYHDRAYPILRELRIPAVVFLATDFMDRGGLMWTEAVHWAGMNSRKASIALPWKPECTLPLASNAERTALVDEAKSHLKGVANEDRLGQVAALLSALDAPSPEASLGRQMLSWDEVRATREGTRYGGHSHTHPILSQLEPPDLESEIRTCRDRIEAETGEAPRTFAYPNGRAVDFNSFTRDALHRHGFEIAFSTIEGINGPDADLLALRRQAAGVATLGDLAAIVARA